MPEVTVVPSPTSPTPPVSGVPVSVPVSQPVQAMPETPKAPEQVLDPKLKALARQQRALLQEKRALQAEKQQWAEKEKQYQSQYISRDALSKDTLGTLREMGITYDQLVQAALNQPTAQDLALQETNRRIEELQKRQELAEKQVIENQRKQYSQAVNQIRMEASELIASNPEYETIKETGSSEAVVRYIEEVFNKKGKLLTIDEAAKDVEEFLVEEALRSANLKKVRAKLNPPASAGIQIPQKQPQIIQKTAPIKTLTNAAVAASSKPLTNKDRRERAILAFKGQLT